MIKYLLILLFFMSCKTTETKVYLNDPCQCSSFADSLQEKMQNTYLSPNKKYYIQDNYGNQTFHYWHNAHAMDVLIDGYERTKDKNYLAKVSNLLDGMYVTNNNSFINDFYDDMGWLGLAVLRAYENTHEIKYLHTAKILWEDMLTGINNNDGRSLSWSKPTPEFKNTPANGPAIMLGLRLYKYTNEAPYKDTAVMMYNWLFPTLINPENGISWDGIKNGKLEKAIYTYNQGLFIGASLEMFNLTKDKQYLRRAIKTAKGSISSSSISQNGILKSEGQGDGGLFKGIFIRYFVDLIENPFLDKQNKQLFLKFITKNAETMYLMGTDHKNLFVNYDWNHKPSGKIDLSTQLSAMMLAETMAELEKSKTIK